MNIFYSINKRFILSGGIICIILLGLFAGPAARAIDYDLPAPDERDVFEQLDDFQNYTQNPFEDVPRSHWAYEAVAHLAELGLLDGYDGARFRGDMVVTRYEMAQMVDKIFRKYLEWTDTGKVTSYTKVRVRKQPLPPPGGVLNPVVGATSAGEAVPLRKISPPLPSIGPSPSKNEIVTLDGRSVTLTRTGPRAMQIPVESRSGLPSVDRVTGEEQKRIEAEEKAAEEAAAKKLEEPEPPEPEWEERLEKIQQEIELSQKDLDTIEKLVNTFKQELKDLDKKIGKEIKDIERIALKNQRQIESLKREDERFRMTGSNNFFFKTVDALQEYIKTIEWTYRPDEQNIKKIIGYTKLYNRLNLGFESKPDPNEDLTLKTVFEAKTQLGGRRGYYGYIDGSNTALSIKDINLNYLNKKQDSKNPRNFKLEGLALGDVSVMYSPLTVFGRKVQGLSLSTRLNDYNINAFGGRMSYHYPLFLGQMSFHKPGDDTQYDRYLYGFNLGGTVFGNPASMGNISKIFMYDNYHTSYYGRSYLYDQVKCEPGYWLEMRYWNDPSEPVGVDSDELFKDMFCLPPEKNSVTSMFVRYPLKGGVNITAEYAHSTYYKPAYGVVKDYIAVPPWMNDDDQPIKVLDPYYVCDTNNVLDINKCWFPSKERNEQDDAFLLMLDFNAGPFSIFPLAYIRLGPEFTTKYFGLPGFDLGSFAGGGEFDRDEKEESSGGDLLGGMSFLPISLQSLELYVANLTYDQTQSKNYSIKTYYITGNEIKPMYFDPGAVAFGLSNNSNKGTTLGVLGSFIMKVNTRRETLKLNVWNNDIKYYLSDKINFNFKHTRVTAMLPESCLDGNIVEPVDDHGNIINKYTGDGYYLCGIDSSDATLKLDVKIENQNYIINWKTSKKSTLESNFGISTIKLTVNFPSVPQVEEIILDLAPHGTYYTMSHKYDYRLTDSTNILFFVEKQYDRAPNVDSEIDELLTDEPGYKYNYEKYPVIDQIKFMIKISTQF